MLGLFKTKPLLSEQDLDFQVATYRWLLKNFGGNDFYEESKLVLPTREHFPSKIEHEDEAANETFLAVKKYAGMEEWPCKLVRQEEDTDILVAPTLIVQNAPVNPLGTFEAKDTSEIIITYNPAIVRDPTQLVATFAHELAHYLTGSGAEEPPGGWDNWEFATDIAAVFLGFGIFMANAAFSFKQTADCDSQGWQSNRSGYLAESEFIFSLAIFMGLKNIPLEQASRFLKPNLGKLLERALVELSTTNILAELSAVEYVPASSY